MHPLEDKEIFILSNIAKKSSTSQRELAKTSGLSLGMINFIIKKFTKDGYLEATYLNKKKMKYFLTPLGQDAIKRSTYKYALSTIQSYNRIQDNLSNLFKKLHSSGYEYFSIHGDGELKNLVAAIFRSALEDAPVTLGKEHKEHPRAVMLNITADAPEDGFKGDIINILEAIGHE